MAGCSLLPSQVETIVPYRTQVQLEASAAQLGPNDEYVDMAIKSEYLEPLLGLTHETTAVIEPVDVSFSRYQGLCSEMRVLTSLAWKLQMIRLCLDDG